MKAKKTHITFVACIVESVNLQCRHTWWMSAMHSYSHECFLFSPMLVFVWWKTLARTFGMNFSDFFYSWNTCKRPCLCKKNELSFMKSSGLHHWGSYRKWVAVGGYWCRRHWVGHETTCHKNPRCVNCSSSFMFEFHNAHSSAHGREEYNIPQKV